MIQSLQRLESGDRSALPTFHLHFQQIMELYKKVLCAIIIHVPPIVIHVSPESSNQPLATSKSPVSRYIHLLTTTPTPTPTHVTNGTQGP